MAEKRLTPEELDQVGLAAIEMAWDNRQKLTALFQHFEGQGEPLPAAGVNDQGDLVVNRSKLARLAKIQQGKQVFKTQYARALLNQAIVKCGITDPKTANEPDETRVVREKMQDTVDAARRALSTTDKKLHAALSEIERLKAENSSLAAHITCLEQQLAAAHAQLSTAESRVFEIAQHEQISLRRSR